MFNAAAGYAAGDSIEIEFRQQQISDGVAQVLTGAANGPRFTTAIRHVDPWGVAVPGSYATGTAGRSLHTARAGSTALETDYDNATKEMVRYDEDGAVGASVIAQMQAAENAGVTEVRDSS